MSQSIAAFLARLTTDPSLGSLLHKQYTLLPGQWPDQELPTFLPPWLTTLVSTQGIVRLAVHQAQALDLLRLGRRCIFSQRT